VTAHIVSVNVVHALIPDVRGDLDLTAIDKRGQPGRVHVGPLGLTDDDQYDKKHHGGVKQAVYAYAREDADWWEKELGRPLEHGVFGENLTVAGLDVTGAVVGERWAAGTVILEVAQPRIPCWKLGARMADPAFPVHFAAAGRPGAYLRIVEEGEIGAGDEIDVSDRPEHGLTVGDVARIFHQERARANALLTVPEIAPEWREWALKRIGDPVG
jgi:MOSC domain-containing protein YiiM